MKKILLKGILFLTLLFVLATLLQSLIDKGLRNHNSGEFKGWNDIISRKINADILIQGSSRAYRHFSPSILDSAFKTNSYNLGLKGYSFTMQYYRLLLYLSYNPPPKYIIQNVDPATFAKSVHLIYYYQFLPYLNNEIIKEAVSSYNVFDWRDYYIPLYKYRSAYNLAFRGCAYNFCKPQGNRKRYKGFNPLTLRWNPEFDNFKLNNPADFHVETDKAAIDLFARFLDFCQTKGIAVILVYSPEYFEAKKMRLNGDSVMNIFRNYSAIYHIPFFDYSNDSICFDTANFYNSQHLNAMGIRKFNMKLVRDLKGVIPSR